MHACLCVSGASCLIDLFPCGTRVSDNEPLMSAGRLQSALRLSLWTNTSEHTVGHGCAHNQTAPSTKAPGQLKLILDTSSAGSVAPGNLAPLAGLDSLRLKHTPVKRLAGSSQDAANDPEPPHLRTLRTQITGHRMWLINSFVGFIFPAPL